MTNNLLGVELLYLTQGGEPEEDGLGICKRLVQPYAYTYECRKLDQENLLDPGIRSYMTVITPEARFWIRPWCLCFAWQPRSSS